jgi:cell division protease FtsH
MDNDRQDENRNPEGETSRMPRNLNFWILLFVVGSLIAWLVLSLRSFDNYSTITLSYFKNLINGRDFNGESVKIEGEPVKSFIESVEITDDGAYGTFRIVPDPEPPRDGSGQPAALRKKFYVALPPYDQSRDEILKQLEAVGVQTTVRPASNAVNMYTAIFVLISLGLLLLMFLSLRRAQNQMMGGGGFLSGFSRSPAKRYESSNQPVTFSDVAGLEGVKADLQEIVEFLREPGKFRKLGGRVPKGVLLVGPPGTGKTLLARAVAGEAEVPFFSVNGSEFIQMFVGVGASRVRDLFATAKAQSPAIVFIDEIDAVGRQRGAGLGGGHDEREQTLNQILGEMDGFQPNDSVIVLAATNRPDILDPALLRPGRFDRHVTVSRPTLKGRKEIFKVHVRHVPLSDDVDLGVLAQATAGMTGADIQNLVNEAALWAARNDKSFVDMSDFYYAHDKVLMGAKREEILTEKEKERTALHEAGHTLAAWNLKGAYPVHKVTIIPRGQSLGVTQMIPDEDRVNLTENEIRDNLVVLLAGRAAEKLVYDEFTVGAENDLERATSMARRMVTHWGMSSKLGPVSYKMTDEDPFLGREIHKNRQFSEHTMEIIDDEVARILQNASTTALGLLKERHDQLRALAAELLVQEELDRNEIAALIGPSVHGEHPKEYREIAPDSTNHDTTNGAPLTDPPKSEKVKRGD